MEMASASGIELIRPEERNPLVATTHGTGELIRHALDQGVERIIIGIGGSATVDGGIGMADALGFRFYDSTGTRLPALAQHLSQIHHIETSQVDPRISQLRVDIASDVQSLLTGEKGAARVFGPQKGADPGMVEVLEAGLEHLFGVWKAQGMLEDQTPGDGAAGGLGAGLRAFLGAESASGAELVGRLGGFLDELEDSKLVITGEGQTDEQTGSGKVCAYVAAQAQNRGIPVILVSGGLAGDFSQLLNVYDLAFSISPGVMSLDAALAATRENLEYYGRLISRILYRSWPGVMERESGRHR
jgi:glycerate kinase